MNEFLLVAAFLIVLMVAIGLARILRGSNDVEKLMAVQLLGTGGIAALLLIAYATIVPGIEDVALGLALLAPFLVFGIVARRGATAGFRFDPIPQAMVITGIVVAFAASAIAVALILRLSAESDHVTLKPDVWTRPPGGNTR
jgi:multisubunit Na+/H+ antiporter MnhC subunit